MISSFTTILPPPHSSFQNFLKHFRVFPTPPTQIFRMRAWACGSFHSTQEVYHRSRLCTKIDFLHETKTGMNWLIGSHLKTSRGWLSIHIDPIIVDIFIQSNVVKEFLLKMCHFSKWLNETRGFLGPFKSPARLKSSVYPVRLFTYITQSDSTSHHGSLLWWRGMM